MGSEVLITDIYYCLHDNYTQYWQYGILTAWLYDLNNGKCLLGHVHIFLLFSFFLTQLNWLSFSIIPSPHPPLPFPARNNFSMKKFPRAWHCIDELGCEQNKYQNSLEPGSAWGKKERKIGERSEPRGSLGREKGGAALSPPQATARLVSLADFFPPFIVFFPYGGAWSQAKRDLMIRGLRWQRKRRWKKEFAFFQSSPRLLRVTNFVKCRWTPLKLNS